MIQSTAANNRMGEKEKSQGVEITQSPDFNLVKMLWQNIKIAVHK